MVAREPPSSSSSSSVLTSLRYYDELRENATRPQGSNLDIVAVEEDQEDEGSSSSSLVMICHLSTVYAMRDGSNTPITGRYEEAFAIALAAHHLNERDGSLIPEMPEILNEYCPPLHFTVEFADVGTDTGKGLETVIQQTDRSQNRPSAFLGAYRSAMSIPTSIITGLRGYPQVSGSSSSEALNDKSSHPLFARMLGSDYENANPVLAFLRDNLQVKYLAVLHLNEPYGNTYTDGLRESVKKLFPDVSLQTVSMPYEELDKESIANAVQSLKQTRYRYFFCILFDVVDEVLIEAYHQGIAGNPNYVWIFSDALEPSQILSRSFERDSVLHQVYQGTGFIGFTAGTAPAAQAFSSQMESLNNPHDLEWMAKQTPDNPAIYDERFLRPFNSPYSPFFYDAAIALGLSACKAAQQQQPSDEDGAGGSDGIWTLNGKEHYEAMVQQEFMGVTGRVRLDTTTGTRTSTYYTYSNFVEDPQISTATTVQFQQVVTNIYQEGSNWTKLQDHVFQSGTTDIPPDLPPFQLNENHLSLGTRIVTLIMCAIAVLMAIEFASWTYRSAYKRVVLASQPFFLYLCCLGSTVLACAIIPALMDLSWASWHGCKIACNAILWLATIGFSLVFSALGAKTYRTNLVLNNPKPFKRISVSVSDVAKPMIGLLSVNLLVLSLMTALHPLEWEVIVANIDSLRNIPSETYGKCAVELEHIPYFVILALVNLGTLCAALFQAWKARNLTTEFAESQYIFKALVTILLVIFVCGPVVLLANDNPDAYIFVRCAIAFVTSTATLLWIFIPKIQYAAKDDESQMARIRISGLDDLTSHNNQQLATILHNNDQASVGASSQNSSVGGGRPGERILSRMSQTELVTQNASLMKELERLRATQGPAEDPDTDLSIGDSSEEGPATSDLSIDDHD